MSNLIKSEFQGEVFYYNVDTNESGCSVRALSRLSGVNKSTIGVLIDKISESTSPGALELPENLKTYAGQVFEAVALE